MKYLKIEITETAHIDDFDNIRLNIDELSKLGCSIAMDDFGTGFSSLLWLRSLPFDTLKIDASFISSMLNEKEARKIVTALVGLGQSLDLMVVAEGVETEEQANLLKRMGCNFAQGFLFGKSIIAEGVRLHLTPNPNTELLHPQERMTLEERAFQITALYNSADTSIAFLNTEFIIVDASEAFAQRHGRLITDIVGYKLAYVSADKFRRLNTLTQKISKGERCLPFEFTVSNGQTDLVSFSQVTDEVGDLLGYSILAIDLTAQKNAENALKKAMNNFV